MNDHFICTVFTCRNNCLFLKIISQSWSIEFRNSSIIYVSTVMIVSLLNCQLYTLYYLGLAEADENCKRFMDRALPECFKKVCDM